MTGRGGRGPLTHERATALLEEHTRKVYRDSAERRRLDPGAIYRRAPISACLGAELISWGTGRLVREVETLAAREDLGDVRVVTLPSQVAPADLAGEEAA